MARTVKELKELHDQLQNEVDGLSACVRDDVLREVKLLFAREKANIVQQLDELIAKKLHSYFIVASLITGVLVAIGYLAVIPKAINDAVGGNARSRVKELLTETENDAKSVREHLDKIFGLPRRVILFTDYGPNSGYAASFSGALYRLDPKARVESYQFLNSDFDLQKASWLLWRYSRTFPPKTIVVSLANPGAKVLDKIVLVTDTGPTFIAHNNGLLDHVASEFGVKELRRVTNPSLNPQSLTNPFKGGGAFAPIAAHLTQERDLDGIGTAIASYQPKLAPLKKSIDVKAHSAEGTVVDIDVFGNIETNLLEEELVPIGIREGVVATVTISKSGQAQKQLKLPIKETYGQVSPGEGVVVYYEGILKIGINNGDFADAHNLREADSISVTSQ